MFAHGASIILALNSSRFKEIIQYRYDIKRGLLVANSHNYAILLNLFLAIKCMKHTLSQLLSSQNNICKLRYRYF